MTKGFDPFKAFEKVGKTVGSELAGGVVHAFGGGKRAETAARNLGGTLGEVGAPLAGVALGAFKTGGKIAIKGKKKGAPVHIIAHQGEVILPIGVKPTIAQQKAIAKRKADEKKKK